MNIKSKIIKEIDTLSESSLAEILIHIQQIKAKQENNNDVWQTYLKSKQERKEVYRRLADS